MVKAAVARPVLRPPLTRCFVICSLVWASLTSWLAVREGSGGKADGEVDALAEADVLEDVEVAVGFVLIVVAHGDDVV